jgi:hypothetical protein
VASNHKVSTTDGVQELLMQAFNVKSTTGDSVITDIGVTVNATATAGLPSTLFLYDAASGGNKLGSVAAGATDGSVATFTDLTINVGKDVTKTLYIKATFPTTANGQQASTSIATAYAVQYEKPDGSAASGGPTSEIAGNDQYFDSAVPVWTLITPTPIPSVTAAGIADAASTTISATLTFKVHAEGGALTKPVIADFGLAFASTSATTYSTQTVVGGAWNAIGTGDTGFSSRIESIAPPDSAVGDGGDYTVTVLAELKAGNSDGTSNIARASTRFFLVATSTRATVGGNDIRQTWDVSEWHTPSAQLRHTN